MPVMGLAFQPNLIGVMSQFSQFEATLRKHIATATETAAGVIGDFQVGYMWATFNDPTGPLEDSVGVRMQSEYLAWIGPDPSEAASVYAWRRDRGFSGMTDSAGRFFPWDPGIHYAEESIKDPNVLMHVAEIYTEAVYAAWQECIGNLPKGTSTMMGIM